MEASILQEVGLTPAEVKIYLALLRIGSSRAGEIVKETGLQNSVVHLTLGKLVDKGFASFVRRGSVKHYQASDPRNIGRWLDEKKARFERALPALSNLQSVHETQEAEVFEGLQGFRAMCYKFIEDAKPGDEYLIFAFITAIEQLDREVYSFYREFTEDRKRRGLVLRGIAHSERRQLFQELGYDLGKWIFVDYPALQNVSVCGNKIIMTPWQYKPVSFLITSQQVADNYREYFNSIWNQNRKQSKSK